MERARDGLKRAQYLQLELQKQAKDYYKILGVRRSATEQEIISAYRRLARKWYPDLYKGNKKEAEKKFVNIVNGKDVLTDPINELNLTMEEILIRDEDDLRNEIKIMIN